MRTLLMGFTPDPDDAFAAHALVHGKVTLPGFRLNFVTAPIERLNEMASRGELDVAAISSAYYPYLFASHDVLRSGASVGRGYGPLLAARERLEPADLRARPVAVPGRTSTAAALLKLLVPGARCVPLPFDAVAGAVLEGKCAAGVLVHEDLLNFDSLGLVKVLCLGEEWQTRTGLPLPVGLNVIRSALDPRLKAGFAWSLRESVRHALCRPGEAHRWARRFARSPTPARAARFARMFANEDTVHLPPDCEQGLRELLVRLHAAGIAPRAPAPRFIEPLSCVRRSTSRRSFHART